MAVARHAPPHYSPLHPCSGLPRVWGRGPCTVSEEGRAGLRVEGHEATSPLLHSPPRESVSVVLGQHFFNRTTDVTQTFGIEKYIPYPLYSVFNPSDHDLGEAPPGACAGAAPGWPGGVLRLSQEGWERWGLGEGGGREKGRRRGKVVCSSLWGLPGHSRTAPRAVPV